MQFPIITALTALAGLAASSPTSQFPSVNDPKYFSIIAIQSDRAIQNATFSAAHSNLIANLTSQNASCDAQGPNSNIATLTLNNGTLELYTASSYPQQFFVDRSGMGQGKLGYTSGAQPIVRNGERQGWNIKEGYLNFDESGLIACPGALGGGWSVWVENGIENPAGLTNCTAFAARVVEIKDPVGCRYSF